MHQLSIPSISFYEALSKSINGIGNEENKEIYSAVFSKEYSSYVERDFQEKARMGHLCYLNRICSDHDDVFITGNLKKSHLVKLYSQYFVPEGKPGRSIYNKLKITANGKCPFCGGIGHVRVLDHYLPKASFPLYSVMPGNLIPCCNDCNVEKSDRFGSIVGEQTLNPYFDNEKFFTDKWVSAQLIIEQLVGDPPVIQYNVSPPDNWTQEEKQRVSAHFRDYNLAERFSVEAGADLPETIVTRKTTLRNYSADEYSGYLLEKGNNKDLPINNWRRVMFTCLASDRWFLNAFVS